MWCFWDSYFVAASTHHLALRVRSHAGAWEREWFTSTSVHSPTNSDYLGVTVNCPKRRAVLTAPIWSATKQLELNITWPIFIKPQSKDTHDNQKSNRDVNTN